MMLPLRDMLLFHESKYLRVEAKGLFLVDHYIRRVSLQAGQLDLDHEARIPDSAIDTLVS